MDSELFNSIIENLDNRISKCESYLGGLSNQEDFKRITIGRALDLRDFCKKESSEMTHIVQSELYHILGMGNLTVVQTSKLVFKIQKYLSFRTDMKTISATLSVLDNLPSLKTASSYKIEYLGDFTLTQKIRRVEVSELVDNDSNEELVGENEQNSTVEPLFTKINSAKYVISEKRLTEFYNVYRKSLLSNGSLENITKKISSGGRYCGFKWNKEDDNIILIPTTKEVKQKCIEQLK